MVALELLTDSDFAWAATAIDKFVTANSSDDINPDVLRLGIAFL